MSTPTDLELMMYADGELEPARLAEVEAFLAGDESAQAKLSSLHFAGDLVRERAETFTQSLDAAEGIADLVMAKIAAGEALEDVAPQKGRSDNVIPMRPRSSVKAAPPAAKRSDSGRTIFMLAAAAVAAAAAMMLWSKGDAPVPAEVAVLAPEAAPAVHAPSAEVAAASPSPEGEADADVGVEVAVVDFGSRTGTIFYVPSVEAPGPMTTVVWVTDSAGGE